MQGNNWIIDKRDESNIIDKLGLKSDTEEFYRDYDEWLPDARWENETMLLCPNCESNERVGTHGFQNHHHARCIFEVN